MQSLLYLKYFFEQENRNKSQISIPWAISESSLGEAWPLHLADVQLISQTSSQLLRPLMTQEWSVHLFLSSDCTLAASQATPDGGQARYSLATIDASLMSATKVLSAPT